MSDACYICRAENGSIELHHIWMQAAGGEAGPTVPLCATCHSLAHKQALNFESKTAKHTIMFSPDQWIRAKSIVGYIQLAIRQNRFNPNGEHPYNLQVKLTKQDVFFLHIMKRDNGYTNLQNFIQDIIRAKIKSKFPTYRKS